MGKKMMKFVREVSESGNALFACATLGVVIATLLVVLDDTLGAIYWMLWAIYFLGCRHTLMTQKIRHAAVIRLKEGSIEIQSIGSTISIVNERSDTELPQPGSGDSGGSTVQ